MPLKEAWEVRLALSKGFQDESRAEFSEHRLKLHGFGGIALQGFDDAGPAI